MKQKEVTINGVQYPVVFTLDTLFGVEDIIGGSFFEANFGTLKNRMALVLAAIYSADDKADITVDQLKEMNPMQMIQDMHKAGEKPFNREYNERQFQQYLEMLSKQ